MAVARVAHREVVLAGRTRPPAIPDMEARRERRDSAAARQRRSADSGGVGGSRGVGGSGGVGGAEAADTGAGASPLGSGGSPVTTPVSLGGGGAGTGGAADAGLRDDASATGGTTASVSGPPSPPDAAKPAAASLWLCRFDYETADAGYGRPLCAMEPGSSGADGKVAASREDATEPEGPHRGSVEFTTSFGRTRTEVRVRSGEETPETQNWAGLSSLHATIKVVTAGSLATVALGVGARNSTARSFNRTYDLSQLATGQWVDVLYDLSDRDASVQPANIGRIVLQLSAPAGGGAGAAAPREATLLIDDVYVE